MVGIINPNGNKTLDDYKSSAGELSKGVTPGTEPYGGELVDNDGSSDDDNDSDNDDGDDDSSSDNSSDDSDDSNDDDDSAAGALKIPIIGGLGLVGAVVLMA